MSGGPGGFLGVGSDVQLNVEASDEVIRRGVLAASLWMRAGGAPLTREAWMLLAPAERAALVAAGDAMRFENIGLLARALSDPTFANLLLERSAKLLASSEQGAADRRTAALDDAMKGGPE